MVRSAHLFAVVVLAAAIPGAALADGPTWSQIKATSSWEHLSDRDHDEAGTVKVAVAEIGGLKCLRGSATVAGKAEVFLGVATDIKGSTKWSTAGLSESAVLGGSGNIIDYYQYLDVPGWTGASDRFWFLRGTKEVSGASQTFWWDRMGEGGGPYAERFTKVQTDHPKAVEPPLNVGGWIFTQSGGNVDIGYYVCSDTGGSLPRAIQYAAAKQTLPDTLGDLVREGQKRSK